MRPNLQYIASSKKMYQDRHSQTGEDPGKQARMAEKLDFK